MINNLIYSVEQYIKFIQIDVSNLKDSKLKVINIQMLMLNMIKVNIKDSKKNQKDHTKLIKSKRIMSNLRNTK